MFHLGTNFDGRSRHCQYCSAQCNGLVHEGGAWYCSIYGKCSLSQERTWLRWSSNIVLTSGRLVNLTNNIVLFPICMDTQLDTYNILIPLVLLLHTTCTFNPMHGTVYISMRWGTIAVWHTFVEWLPTPLFSRLDCAAVGGSKHSALVNFLSYFKMLFVCVHYVFITFWKEMNVTQCIVNIITYILNDKCCLMKDFILLVML